MFENSIGYEKKLDLIHKLYDTTVYVHLNGLYKHFAARIIDTIPAERHIMYSCTEHLTMSVLVF